MPLALFYTAAWIHEYPNLLKLFFIHIHHSFLLSPHMFFEAGSHRVVQTGLGLLINNDPPALPSLVSVGVTGSHQMSSSPNNTFYEPYYTFFCGF